MAQPAAAARKSIRSLLERIIEHEIKMNIAEKVDARFGGSFQASRSYWQKESERLWQEIEKTNRTTLRRRGQFFSDAEIIQWKEELIENGITLAVNRLMKDLRQHGIQGEARWLQHIAEELYG